MIESQFSLPRHGSQWPGGLPIPVAAGEREPTLMIVHAHPDDESSQTGGTLAAYAAAGWRTILVTCTDGGQGDGPGGVKPGQPGHDPDEVARRRSRELDTAATILGVRELIRLGYPDSGMTAEADTPTAPTCFSRRPLRPMATRLAELMWLHRPEVVVTYPPNGLSGHPDHVRTHHLVHAALEIVDARAESPGPSPLVHYIAMSRTRLGALQSAARAVFGPDAWVPPDEMATDDAAITTVIDVTAQWEIKIEALSAHASQPDAAAVAKILIAAGTANGLDERVEEYVRARAASVNADSGDRELS